MIQKIKNILALIISLFTINCLSQNQTYYINPSFDGDSVGVLTLNFPLLSTNTYSLTNTIYQTNFVSIPVIVNKTNYTYSTNIVTIYVTNTPPTTSFSQTFEAENGNITAPFVKSATYISQGSESASVSAGGKVTFLVNIPVNGNYKVSLNVNAPNDSANSVWVNFNSTPTDPSMVSDITLTSGYQNRVLSWRGNGTYTSNQFVPKIWRLTAGTNTLIIVGREANVLIDKVIIQSE